MASIVVHATSTHLDDWVVGQLKAGGTWRRALWLSSPLLVTVLWFEALSSHTQWHLTVSSRSAALAVAIALSAAVLSMQQRPSLRDLRLHVDLMAAKLRRRRPN